MAVWIVAALVLLLPAAAQADHPRDGTEPAVGLEHMRQHAPPGPAS